MESGGLRWREADVAPSFRAKKFLNETVIGNAKSNPKRRIEMEVNRLSLLPSRTTASLLLGLPPTRLSLLLPYYGLPPDSCVYVEMARKRHRRGVEIV